MNFSSTFASALRNTAGGGFYSAFCHILLVLTACLSYSKEHTRRKY